MGFGGGLILVDLTLGLLVTGGCFDLLCLGVCCYYWWRVWLVVGCLGSFAVLGGWWLMLAGLVVLLLVILVLSIAWRLRCLFMVVVLLICA